MASSSRRGAFLLFGIILLAALLITFATLRMQSDASRWVVHTREVINRLDSTLSILEGAETGQRGYLLTGDAAFLDSYRTAMSTLPATLDALGRLVADNDVQTRTLMAVRSDAQEKMAVLADTITLQDAGQSAGAIATVRSGRGKAIMDRLRGDLASMRAEEERLLEERSTRASRARDWTLGTVSALGILALFLLWLLRSLMARDVARLRMSEERLATTVASVGDAVISTDAQGLIERMNPVAEQLTGWTLAQAAGMPLDVVFRIINEHTRETVESPLAKVLREGRAVGLANHTLLIAHDGTERPIEDSGAPIRGAEGSVTGVVLVFKDATERYAAERQLRDSEERFRALAGNIPQLAWIADAGTEGQVHWFNQKWFEYTGTTLEEMKGSGWHRVHHPEHAERVIRKFAQHVKEGLDWEDLFPLRAKNGDYRWFLSRMTAIRDTSGQVVRIFGTNTDITEQRQMQDELQRLAGELALSEERLRAAVAAVQGIVWTNNAVGEMQGEQPDWARLTGQSREEYQGFGWARAVHPDDAQPTIDAWQATIASQKPFHFEHRVHRHDGQWRNFAIHAIPVFDQEGVLQQWVGMHMDVTELRRLERERTHLLEAEQSARTQAENANRTKDEFLATLSHELRTPITIIVGWSRLLLKRHGDANDDLTKGLNLIINNAMGQAQIISDLLDMSSIVSGKMILNLKPLDLRDCVAQSVAAHQLAAKDKGVDLVVDENGEPHVVLADAGRLQQVLSNLLTNALKFTPAGGRIAVRTQAVRETFEVSIEDTGQGIAPEFLPQIFGKFRQGESFADRKHGGLGLGLAIVKQIVELHGGSARAESEGRNQGARFTICLPARPVAAPSSIVSGATETAEQTVDSLKGAHALVVEDNVSMLEFLIRILEERGALVIGVRSAPAALEALVAPQGVAFNILVSDIGLGGMDGYELIRKVRSELNIPRERLAAIAVTALGRQEDRQHALEAGFQAHLAKPYDVTQLVSIVCRLSKNDDSKNNG
jgi:PAS domain S-box-containing protein